MMTIISLLLLVSLLPHLTFTGETDYLTAYHINWYLLNKLTDSSLSLSAHVDVGIVNGTEAKPHSRPFMVSLQKNWRHICGGFLISDRFVMTAAHCWKNEKLTAVVGAHDLRQNKGSVRIGVKSYHMHPKFNMHTLQNDIMLLRVTVVQITVIKRLVRLSFNDDNVFVLQLEKEVEQNRNVMKISIPKNERDIKADSVCRVAGWGRLSFKGKKSFRLMEADVKIMNNTECKNKWKDKFSASEMMCVHGNGGSCSVCKNVIELRQSLVRSTVSFQSCVDLCSFTGGWRRSFGL
uniref:trypsin n=1 Tax=Sinocyclocheilus rhinocerous TaxID=307959 RepID=A0A673KJF3_9TELE